MIVLIGGNGFLGRHLRRLIEQTLDEDVTIVSRRPSDIPLGPREEFLTSQAFCTDHSADVIRMASSIIYLATASTPSVFAQEPWRELSENASPALFQFERIAKLNPTARIVLLSSGGTVYGNNGSSGPVEEQTFPAPISAYGLGKVAIEEALKFVHRTRAVPISILRLSNPVGEFAQGGVQGLIPNILNSIRTGNPLPVFGDGSHVRDYVDADETAAAILMAAQDRVHNSVVWNVGSGIGLSTSAVIAEIERITGRPVPLTEMPARALDVQSIVLNCSLIKCNLGWKANKSIFETISQIWSAQSEAAQCSASDNAR